MKRVIFLVFLFFRIIGFSQENLVIDPSFEKYKFCPSEIISDIKKFPLKYWTIPTSGTTDYFNVCSDRGGVSIPKNQLGIQETRTGMGYVGLLCSKFESEYIQGELTKSLIKDSFYYAEFYVSLGDYSLVYASNLGVYFSQNKRKESTVESLKLIPQVFSNEFIKEKDNWIKISGSFKATGGEKFLVIGCFGNKESFKKIKRKEHPKKKFAYYYLDDVCVKQVKEGEKCDCEEKPVLANEKTEPIKVEDFVVGKLIVLPDITFETNKWELSENVKPLLDSLANYLQNHSAYNLMVEGFTDNVGKVDVNQRLSENRAKSIQDYLSQKGVKKERIQIKGYGSSKPISTDDTEEGRAKNRRVELRILEKDN